MGNLLLSVQHTLRNGPQNSAVPRPRPDYQSLINSLPQTVFLVDRAGCSTWLSEGWPRLSGCSVQESLGTRWLDYVHPKDRDACGEYFDAVIRGAGRQDPITVRCLVKQGDFRWMEVHAGCLIDGTGEVAGIAGLLINVTARVREERRLLASHRNLTGLLDHLPGLAYRGRNNPDWPMEYVSAGSLELTGYSAADLINDNTLAFGNLIHPDDRERVWNAVQIALRENRRFDLVYRIRSAQGREKWVWECGTGIYSNSGELLGLEGFITDITRHKRAEERLRRGLLYDPSTGLRTPPVFLDHLRRALDATRTAREGRFALLLVHLDHLAEALGKFGPDDEDRVFLEISRRLTRVVRPSDVMSRLEDDRFAILLDRSDDIKALTSVARRIQEQLLAPVRVGDAEIYMTASIGIALSGSGYRHGEDVLRDAYIALDRARALGGARHEVFDLRTHARAAALSQMESELQLALEHNRFRVYWQPAVAGQSGRIVGLEARLVWPHPRRGLLFAEDFVPLAEDTQLIPALWEWMLKEVCRQLASWQRLPSTQRLAINVQIFGKTLLDAELILRLGEDLRALEPQPVNLALGVLEGALSRSPLGAAELAKRLKARNVSLILDGFGGAASSLSVLKDMPIDLVRLDKSLITDSDADSDYVAAVVSFAHALGIRVLAAGVRTPEQLSSMRALGCDYLQGEAISPPLDEKSAIATLEAADPGLVEP